MLLKTQSNKLFNELQDKGFDLSAFERTEVAGLKQRNHKHAFQIKHSNSGFYFTIEEVEGKRESTFYYEYFPSERNIRVNNISTGLNSFDGILPYFEEWMDSLKAEVEIIDLWELDIKMREALEKITSYPDNTPIKPHEVEKTTKILEEFGAYLKGASLKDNESVSDTQLQQIQSNVDFLIETLPRFGRKDYLALLLSFFINILSTLTVSETVAKEIIGFVGAVFDVLYATSPPLLY